VARTVQNARTYDNKVAATNVPGLPNEHKEFVAILDEHVPSASREKANSSRSSTAGRYRPYPVDSMYAEAGKRVADTHDTQQEVIGVVDVPL